jgi:hypothetical protein
MIPAWLGDAQTCGVYRCITEDGMRAAQQAVHSDLEISRAVYEFVIYA